MSAGHIRERGPNTWRLKYDAGRDPITGKRITRYATVKGAKRDAQREMRRLLAAVDEGRAVDPSKITVAQWLWQWLEEARATTAPKSHEAYSEAVANHLAPALGMLPLARLHPAHVQRFIADALTSRRRCNGTGGLSPRTVRFLCAVLSVAMKRAKALRLIAGDPMEGVSLPRIERGEMRTVSPEDASKLLCAARGGRLYTPTVLALASGMRRGEILALRWQDLDLDAGAVRVARSLEETKAGLRFKEPKTRHGTRTIPLPASAVDALRQHRVAQLEERMLLGLGRAPGDELVFSEIDRAPIRPDLFGRRFSRLVKRAGIPKITFHGLRHSHASALLRANVHPKIASERLGHGSIGITLDLYSHVSLDMQEDAASRIDAGLKAILGS